MFLCVEGSKDIVHLLCSIVLARQQSQGLLPTGTAFDLFRGTAQGQRDEIESFPTILDREIRVPKQCHHECAKFSPDGHMLITGSADGIIEAWDFMTGKIRQDLEYQAEEQFMCHSTAVLCVDLTRDSELLVSGMMLNAGILVDSENTVVKQGQRQEKQVYHLGY